MAANGVLLTISESDFLATLEQMRQNFNDGLNIINGIEAALAGTAAGTPPPAPPPPIATIVTPGVGSFTDSSGGVWTINSGMTILLNGKPAYQGWQTKELVGSQGVVYILGLDGNWYQWNGQAMIPSSKPMGA